MGRNSSILPKSSEDAAKAIYAHSLRMDQYVAFWRVQTQLAMYYAAGYRRFQLKDTYSGTVTPYWLSADGKDIETADQTLLYEVQQILGQIGSMDTRPAVSADGIKTLSTIRERGAAHAILRAMFRPGAADKVLAQFDYAFAFLGMCGVYGEAVSDRALGLYAELELVSPIELMPFPALLPGQSDGAGVCRRRLVTRSYLDDIYGRARTSRLLNSQKAMSYKLEASDPREFLNLTSTSLANYGSLHGASNATDSTVDAIEIIETWIDGPANTVERLVVQSGEYILEDTNFAEAGVEAYRPLQYARFYENGTFHGVGHFGMRFHSVRTGERLRKALFEATLKSSRWPVLLMPQGAVNERVGLKDVGTEGLRYMKWAYDPLMENNPGPLVVNPVSIDRSAGSIAAIADADGQKVNPVPDLLNEKGRIDSASALQFMSSESKKGLTVPTRAKRDMLSGVYRSLAQQASRLLVERPQPVPVSQLSLDLLGVVIDRQTGKVSFTENPIPNIGLLNITVSDAMPNASLGAKMEAFNNFSAGLLDATQLKIFLIQNNIDAALYLDDARAAYDQAVRNILSLYNDGVTPGLAYTAEMVLLPELQLALLRPVIASHEFESATPVVQEALLDYMNLLLMAMGLVLPNGVGSPLANIAPPAGAPVPDTQMENA